ncbi:MAG: S41 family peptidase [Woeseiaceae bacterium]|nr:S41 family peptidase [Woeseiaceae bacterium]
MTRTDPSPPTSRLHRAVFAGCAALLLLAGCGGGGGGSSIAGNGGNGNGSSWTPGVFLDASTFRNMCENPRGGSWPDIQGTTTDENNFLRSYSNDTYLWYDEIVDRDPSLYATLEYFDLLKTEATTASGADKDRFHFTYPTDEWIALSQSGASAGYGVQFAVLEDEPPRSVLVAYTDPGTPATGANLVRGAAILEVDGADMVSGNDVATLNNGLFPAGAGETHDFRVRDPDGTERDITLTSQIITSTPVQNVKTLQTANGPVGYLLFNDHIAPAEPLLVDAIEQLEQDNITDLVIDIRYNGGGYLYIASELAYMIAGANATGGATFEELSFNDKHPSTDPVTGDPLQPMPFFNTSDAGQPLPTLDLARVFVLTGPGTCSASESIINGLRGIDVEVIQIGSTTCGKPYGFYPTDNCGTTYFTIQFRGENDKGFGDYADGFSPQNAPGPQTTPIPGCQVADDFSRPLGDPAEQRLAAALDYIGGAGCPAPTSVNVPGIGKTAARRYADEDLILPRAPWREMRLLERR